MSSRPRRSIGPSRRTVTALVFAVSWLPPALLPSALAAHASGSERAHIEQDGRGDTWTLTAGGARLTLHVDPESGYAVQSLQGPDGGRWLTKAAPDTSIVIRGNRLGFGRRDAGFEFEQAKTRTDGSRVRLDLAFVHRPSGLRATRHVAVVDDSPTFEVWTTLEALGEAVDVSDLNGVELTIPTGTVRWLNGLRGSTSDQGNPEAFLTQERVLGEGDRLTLGAQGRSSETTVPWVSVHGSDDEHPEEFYAGLLWSGAWGLEATNTAEGLTLSIGLPGMTTRVEGRVVETPHVMFGVSEGGIPQAAAAMRQYLVNGVRSGRGFSPLVTYNTWFADGVRISDESIRGEMRRVAGLGAELFVLDAGWYAGTGTDGIFDFSSGLGRWQPDPDRFPDGLRPLTEYAHALGMKFGVWV